jgi:hypothetical protein
MFIIRRTWLAQPGRRDEAVALTKEMAAAAAKAIGFPVSRIVTASIGPSDSTIEMESTANTLAEFEAHLQKMNAWPEMARFSDKLTTLIVPGSGRFEVFREQK